MDIKLKIKKLKYQISKLFFVLFLKITNNYYIKINFNISMKELKNKNYLKKLIKNVILS